MMKVKKEGQGRIFNSAFLELFTKTNAVIHVLTYGGIIVFLFFMNNQPASYFWFILLGVFIWTLVEYLMHRFLFHVNESQFQYTIHGVHHEYPRDKERLFMPPVPGIIIVCIFYAIWYLIFRQNAPLVTIGFLMGYMFYTFIHYIVHAWKPVKGFKILWSHHHKHHNPMYEDKAFGVSSPFWDYIFGTMPSSKKQV